MKKKAKREDLEYNLLKPGNKIKRKFAGDESRGGRESRVMKVEFFSFFLSSSLPETQLSP